MQQRGERYEYSGRAAHSHSTPTVDSGDEARCMDHARRVQRTQPDMQPTPQRQRESSGVSDGREGKRTQRSENKSQKLKVCVNFPDDRRCLEGCFGSGKDTF